MRWLLFLAAVLWTPAISAADLRVERMWERTYSGNDPGTRENAYIKRIAVSEDGAVCGAGHIESGAYGVRRTSRPWVVKLDADGRVLWDIEQTPNRLETATAVAIAPEGGCFVGVERPTDGPDEAVFILLNNVGKEAWRTVVRRDRSCRPAWVSPLPDGGMVTFAHCDRADAFAPPLTVISRLSAGGGPLWIKDVAGKIGKAVLEGDRLIVGMNPPAGAGLVLHSLDPRTGNVSDKPFLERGRRNIGWTTNGHTVFVAEHSESPGVATITALSLDGSQLWTAPAEVGARVEGARDDAAIDAMAVTAGGHAVLAKVTERAAGKSNRIMTGAVGPSGIAWAEASEDLPPGPTASTIFDAAAALDGTVLIAGSSVRLSPDGWRRSTWLRRLRL